MNIIIVSERVQKEFMTFNSPMNLNITMKRIVRRMKPVFQTQMF